jgi:arylsulfatase A-like enzyme
MTFRSFHVLRVWLGVFFLTLYGPVSAGEQSRPNILLVVFEDMSAHIGAYGDPVARTPVLDGFAEQSVVYENVFTAAGVCAPSRAALITGRYQQSFGAQHMRTVNGAALPDGRTVPYDAVPPPEVKAFPELLRAAGYYTTNNGKTDYQFGGHTGGPFTIWDESAAEHPWRGRAEGQPFFAMVNIDETHESYL